MKTTLVDQISRDLNLDRRTLIGQGIRSFLKDRRRSVLLERLELLSRNGVAVKEELQRKIETGEVTDHPAWEDLILLENLEAELQKIDGYLDRL
jgi:hypothetical protein